MFADWLLCSCSIACVFQLDLKPVGRLEVQIRFFKEDNGKSM